MRPTAHAAALIRSAVARGELDAPVACAAAECPFHGSVPFMPFHPDPAQPLVAVWYCPHHHREASLARRMAADPGGERARRRAAALRAARVRRRRAAASGGARVALVLLPLLLLFAVLLVTVGLDL